MTRPLPYIFDKRFPRWGLFISDLPDANWIEYVKHLEAEHDRLRAALRGFADGKHTDREGMSIASAALGEEEP